MTNELVKLETLKSKELKAQKDQYEKIQKTLKPKGTRKVKRKEINVIDESRLKQLEFENEGLAKQIDMMNSQALESKRTYDSLLLTIQNRDQTQIYEQEQKQYFVKQAQDLQVRLDKSEERGLKLETKIDKLKRYRETINSSSHMTCKYCDEKIRSEKFSAHLSVCFEKEGASPAFFNLQQSLIPLKAEIIHQREYNDSKRGYTYSIYDIEVHFKGKMWVVQKRYSLFLEFYDQIRELFQNMDFGTVPIEFI